MNTNIIILASVFPSRGVEVSFDQRLEVSLDCAHCSRTHRTVVFHLANEQGRCTPTGHEFAGRIGDIQVKDKGGLFQREFECSFNLSYEYSPVKDIKYALPQVLVGAEQCLTLPSSGRPQAGFAYLRPPLMSNVRTQAKTTMVITATAANMIREWVQGSAIPHPVVCLVQTSDVPAELDEALKRGLRGKELEEISLTALRKVPKYVYPAVYPRHQFLWMYRNIAGFSFAPLFAHPPSARHAMKTGLLDTAERGLVLKDANGTVVLPTQTSDAF
jgi:hypothetical protein